MPLIGTKGYDLVLMAQPLQTPPLFNRFKFIQLYFGLYPVPMLHIEPDGSTTIYGTSVGKHHSLYQALLENLDPFYGAASTVNQCLIVRTGSSPHGGTPGDFKIMDGSQNWARFRCDGYMESRQSVSPKPASSQEVLNELVDILVNSQLKAQPSRIQPAAPSPVPATATLPQPIKYIQVDFKIDDTKPTASTDGNCKVCNDRGEWRALALMCRNGHGRICG